MGKKHLLLRDYLTKKALEIKSEEKKKRELRSLDKASYTSFFKNAKLTKKCLYHSNIKNSSICFLVFNAIMDYMNDWHDRKHIRYRPVDIRKKFNIPRSSWDKARKLLLENNMIEFYEIDGGTCIQIPLPSEWLNLNDKQRELIRKEMASVNEDDSVLESSDLAPLKTEQGSNPASVKKKNTFNLKSKVHPRIKFNSGKRLDAVENLGDQQLIRELDEMIAQEHEHLSPLEKARKRIGLK